MLYHPLFYKTKLCKNLIAQCKKFECPYYHEDRLEERRDYNSLIRKPESAKEETKKPGKGKKKK